MPHEVKVKTPIAYDPSVVAGALGETPLPLDLEDLVLAPFITVDGRIHGPTSDFLRRHCLTRPNLTTARRMASDLAKWVDYLCNDCGLAPFEDGRDPTFAATEDDFARYYRQRQYGSVDQVLTSQGWARAASTIKRYYENAQRVYQHPPPFEIQSFAHISGFTGTKIARYQPRRRSTGSAGVPLTPEFAELLLMGALRVDINGQQDDYRGADRDHAILSLGLAAGLRRNNLANITTYEIPAMSELPVTTMVVADRITKGDAGGDAQAVGNVAPARVEFARRRSTPGRDGAGGHASGKRRRGAARRGPAVRPRTLDDLLRRGVMAMEDAQAGRGSQLRRLLAPGGALAGKRRTRPGDGGCARQPGPRRLHHG